MRYVLSSSIEVVLTATVFFFWSEPGPKKKLQTGEEKSYQTTSETIWKNIMGNSCSVWELRTSTECRKTDQFWVDVAVKLELRHWGIFFPSVCCTSLSRTRSQKLHSTKGSDDVSFFLPLWKDLLTSFHRCVLIQKGEQADTACFIDSWILYFHSKEWNILDPMTTVISPCYTDSVSDTFSLKSWNFICGKVQVDSHCRMLSLTTVFLLIQGHLVFSTGPAFYHGKL